MTQIFTPRTGWVEKKDFAPRLSDDGAVDVHHYDNGRGGIKVWSQAPHKGQGPDPRGFKHHDSDGVPVVTSKREIDEVVGRTKHTANPLVWDRSFGPGTSGGR